MRSVPTLRLLSLTLLAACSASDAAAPGTPLAGRLWADAPPSAIAAATSAVVTVHLGRAATVAWTVYASSQTLTAGQVREDAAGGGGRRPLRIGSVAITGAQAAAGARVTIDSLPAGAAAFVYLAAVPAQADPTITDGDAVKSVTATLAPLQTTQTYQSAAISSAVGYYTYVPDAQYLDSASRAPLMIFLHGAGEKGNGTTELAKVLVNGPPRLVQAGRRFPFVIVSPQLPASQGGWSVGTVDELIARAKAAYRIDTTRIYVTGLSMGGYGTWAYATARPTVVAAAVPIAGAGNPSAACAMKDVPVWAFHGDADGTVNVSGSIDMVNALKACTPAGKVAPKLTIYPGVGHDSWTRTYDGSAGNDVYAWLLQYHR